MSNTYHIIPGPQMGLISPVELEKITRVALKYNISQIKITSAQRLAFVGLNPKDLNNIWQELGYSQAPEKSNNIHYIQACPGLRHCKYGINDSLELGNRLQKELVDLELPAKTKIGISGCSMNCCESFVRDIGIFAKKSGWTLIFGGNGGGRPRIGDIIGENLDGTQVIDLAQKCLEHYRSKAKPRERTARFMERTGAREFKAKVKS